VYKTTSQSEQHRAVARVLNDRRSETLHDFYKRFDDLSNERDEQTTIKRKAEAELAKLNNAIKGSRIGHPSRVRWFEQRAQQTKIIADAEAKLASIKRHRRAHNQEIQSSHSPLAYVEMFYRVAKVLLPAEIVERINTAALAALANESREIGKPPLLTRREQ
jgi:hypothetical protein